MPTLLYTNHSEDTTLPTRLNEQRGLMTFARPAAVIERLLQEAGFGSPVQIFQSVIYVAWYSRKVA
jgi:hypothetical protein